MYAFVIDLQTFVQRESANRCAVGDGTAWDHSGAVRVTRSTADDICRGGYDKTYNTVSTVKCLAIHLV